MLDTLRKGIYATVTSDRRTMETVPNVYRTTGYLMGPYTALSYAGLLDYRAKTGESREALLLADRSPELDREFMKKAMGEGFSL
jgi:threonine synthase